MVKTEPPGRVDLFVSQLNRASFTMRAASSGLRRCNQTGILNGGALRPVDTSTFKR